MTTTAEVDVAITSFDESGVNIRDDAPVEVSLSELWRVMEKSRIRLGLRSPLFCWYCEKENAQYAYASPTHLLRELE